MIVPNIWKVIKTMFQTTNQRIEAESLINFFKNAEAALLPWGLEGLQKVRFPFASHSWTLKIASMRKVSHQKFVFFAKTWVKPSCESHTPAVLWWCSRVLDCLFHALFTHFSRTCHALIGLGGKATGNHYRFCKSFPVSFIKSMKPYAPSISIDWFGGKSTWHMGVSCKTGCWYTYYTYPSEKWWSSSVGIMKFLSEWKVIKFHGSSHQQSVIINH